MPTTTKGLSGFKSTGNSLMDALQIMSLVPGMAEMKPEEEGLSALVNFAKDMEGKGKAKPATAQAAATPNLSMEGGQALKKLGAKGAKPQVLKGAQMTQGDINTQHKIVEAGRQSIAGDATKLKQL